MINLEELKSKAAAGTLLGAYPDIPSEVYHSFTNYLSATQIGAYARSERHYEALLVNGLDDTASLKKGRLIHLAVGEPNKFSEEVAIGPEVNRNTTAWKSFAAEHEGQMCVKPSEVEEIMQIAQNVHAHPMVGGMFTGALVEWSFFAKCPTTGMLLKCRPDLLTRDYKTLADLKSTQDAHPDEFPKSGFYLNYHVKMAHYMDVIELVTSVRPELGIFIAAETKPPYEVVPFVPEADEWFTIDPLEVGAEEARRIRAMLALRLKEKAECEAEGRTFRWKGYSDKFVPYTLPNHIAKKIAESKGALT